MKIYIDSEYKCHTGPGAGLREVETDFFDGKCGAYVEGYRCIPMGEQWISPDGTVYNGGMISPWKDWKELDSAQREYERKQLAEYESALSEIEKALGVSV